MKIFFYNVLTSMTGTFSFFGVLAVLGALVSIITGKVTKFKTKDNSILEIKLKGNLQEDKFVSNPFTSKFKDTISLKDLKKAIRHAKTDNKIKGILLNFEMFSAGWSHLQDLTEVIEDFKKSKKIVISYGDFYFNPTYYLAISADMVFMPNEGMFVFPGMGVTYRYYAKTFERLKIKPLEFHVGEYKSFPETFTRTEMSKYSRIQTEELLYTMNDIFMKKVSSHRKKSIEDLKKLTQNLTINITDDALKNNLIDSLGYRDDVEDYIKNVCKLDKKKDLNIAPFEKYLTTLDKDKDKGDVAVLLCEGNIIYGKGRPGESIGSEETIKMIKKVRKDKNIKSVVLVINTPGGSSLASDLIYHELKLLKKEKPVIAYMSNVAASGGYYMAAGCDYIIARETTITGSIGIFALLFDIHKLLSCYLGVNFSTVKTDDSADLFSKNYFLLGRGLTDKESKFFQNIMDSGYKSFIEKVAEARKMKVEDVDKVARGRVWTGRAAKEKGLVDEIGSLEKAIQIAAKRAKLDKKYSIIYYPKKKTLLQMIKENPSEAFSKILGYKTPFEKLPFYEDAKKASQMHGIQKALPYDIEIR